MAVAQIKHFDFLQLYEVFVGMCPDFQKEISYETPSISRLFAEKIIFDFSAQIKNIKQSGRDHTWKVDLKSNNEEDIGIKPIKYKIYISTNLFTKPSKAQPKLEGKKLKISFKQASLVAVFKYCQVIPFITQRGEIVFTPLAGAVFNKEFLPSILAELVTLQKVPVGMHNVLIGIICSCQTDGFYLPYSVCHIAVVAICSTVKDLNLRESLVKSTIKQYQRLCKPFDERKFKIYMFYANKQIDVNTLMSVNVIPCEQHKEPQRSSSVEKTNDRKVLDYVTPTPSEKLEIPKKSSQTHYGKSSNVLDMLKKSGLLKRNAKQKQDEIKKSNEIFGTRKQTFKAKAYLPKRHKVPTDEGTSSDKESSEEESSEEDTSGGETDEESDLDEKLAKIALKHL